MSARNPLLASALWYVRNGFPVLALREGTKEPATYHAAHDATLDEQQIIRWWKENPNYNIGIAGSDRLVLIDFDHRTTAVKNRPVRDGIPWFRQKWKEGVFPEQLVVAKTPSNGRHVWLAVPEGQTVPNSKDRVAPGIEVRGFGMYVVAPPSVLTAACDLCNGQGRIGTARCRDCEGRGSKQTGIYEWVPGHSPRDVTLGVMGDPLLAMLQVAGAGEAVPAPQRGSSVGDGNPTPSALNISLTDLEELGNQLVSDAIKLIGTPGVAGRNDAGWWLACQLRDSRFSYFDAEHWQGEYQRVFVRRPLPSGFDYRTSTRFHSRSKYKPSRGS